MPNLLERIADFFSPTTDAAPDAVERTPGSPSTPPAVSSGTHPFLRGLSEYGEGRTLGQPYTQSAWVLRAIRHISDPIGGLPLRFALPGGQGPKVIVDPDLDSFWTRPALGPEGPLSLATVVEATVALLKLDGHCFWVLDDTWLTGSNTPANLRTPFLIIRAGQMKPVFDGPAKGRVIGWFFRDLSGREWPLLPEQVEHLKYWNPYDPVAGASEYSTAKVAAESDAFAGQFVRSLMQGNGDRGPIISPKQAGTVFTDPQRAQMEAALAEKRRANMSGNFRPLFLGGAVEISDPQVASTDSDFVSQRIENRKEIFMAFGVPASLAEPKAKYSIGAESDRYILIEDTCKPMGRKLCDSIVNLAQKQKGMSGKGGDHLIAYFDWDGHSVMQQVREARVEVAGELFAMGMPFATINQLLNLGAPRFPGDDTGFLPFSLQTVKDALAALPGSEDTPAKVPDKTGKDDGKDDPAAKLMRLLSMPAPGTLEYALTAGYAKALEPPVVKTGDAEADERARLWRRYMISRRPAENQTGKAITRVLMAARATVLGKIGESKAITGKVNAADPDDGQSEEADGRSPDSLIFDLSDFTESLVSGLARISRAHMQTAADEVRGELGVDDAWTMPPKEITAALASRRNLISNCADEIWDDIRDALQEGFDAGETTAQLAARVREAFNEAGRGRSQTIAITETGAAYGAGRQSGAASVGAKSKMWLSARDKLVRTTHVEADGQTVAVDGFFHVGGENCSYPCGEGLSAKEACNCRCVSVFRIAPPEGAQ